QFRLLAGRIADEGGAVIKTIGEGLVASFTDAVSAVRAGLGLQSVLAACDTTRHLKLRVGIHRGPAMAATVNDRLDYFGTTARVAGILPARGEAGQLILTHDIANDPSVDALLGTRLADCEVITVDGPGGSAVKAYRINLPEVAQINS